MSIAAKRREMEVFSLSFLDCICCGFGAVLLIFLLTISRKTDVDKAVVDQVREQLKHVGQQQSKAKEDIERLTKILAAAQLELQEINTNALEEQRRLTDREKELALMLQRTGALKDAVNALLAEKKNIPTEDKAPVPIPNVDRRQYLTGVKLQGDFVVFIVRTSGSMLDETIDAAAARLGDSDDKKRAAPKWQRVIASLEWMLASLEPETHFQIFFFNDEVTPIIPTRGEEWFTTSDHKTTAEIVKRLHDVVPHGGANLERAFTAVRFLPRLPDSIILLTDGLPTLSDSVPTDGEVDEPTRIRFFEIATKQLPPRIPVSTILFPLLTGDPASPGLFWELANATRGALVSPSRSWPDL